MPSSSSSPSPSKSSSPLTGTGTPIGSAVGGGVLRKDPATGIVTIDRSVTPTQAVTGTGLASGNKSSGPTSSPSRKSGGSSSSSSNLNPMSNINPELSTPLSPPSRPQGNSTAVQINSSQNSNTNSSPSNFNIQNNGLTFADTITLSNTGKGSGASEQPYRAIVNRVPEGGVLNRVARFLGFKDQPKAVRYPTQSTIVSSSTEDKFSINPAASEKESQVISQFNPLLRAPSQESFNEDLYNHLTSDIIQNIEPKYQARVNAGEDIKIVNTDYNKEIQKQYENRLKDSDVQILLSQRARLNSANEIYKSPAKQLKEAGSTLADVSVGSLGLIAAPEVALTAGIAYGATRAGIDIRQSSNQFGLEKQNTLNRAGEYFAFAGLSAIPLPKALTTKAEIDIFNELKAQRFQITGQELLRTDNGVLFQIRAVRNTPSGYGKQEIEFLSPQFNIQKDALVSLSESGKEIVIQKGSEFTSFFITKGTARTKIVNPLDTNIIKDFNQQFAGGGRATAAQSVRAGINYPRPEFPATGLLRPRYRATESSAKGFDISQEMTGFKASQGYGYLNFNDENINKPFNFIGGVREKDNVYQILSASPNKIKNELGGLKVRGKLQGFGEINKINNFPDNLFGFNNFNEGAFGNNINKESKSILSSQKDFAQPAVFSSVKNVALNVEEKVFSALPKTEKIDTKTSIANAFGLSQRTRNQSSNIFQQQDFFLSEKSPVINIPAPKLPVPTKQNSATDSIIGELQIQPPQTEQRQQDIFKNPIPNGSNFGLPDPFALGGGGFGFGALPTFKLFDEERKSTRGSKSAFKGEYVPNVAAFGLNIRAPKIPKSYKAGFGGLGIRPIISSPRRRRKK